MIAIIDYGMGNLRSVEKALERQGFEPWITDSASGIARADKMILPGVGAFEPAMRRLTELNLIGPITDFVASGKHFLGICLGFQLMFERSEEDGQHTGLGFVKGSVTRFRSGKVPHMGWNQIHFRQPDHPLLRGLPDNMNTYFCHSYFAQPRSSDDVLTVTRYGEEFTSAVARENIFGFQFHPEKSQQAGLRLLNNFARLS